VPERRGQLLIATSPLKDPNFHRTVVLIVRDDENGTFGLVLNRPLETTVKDAVEGAVIGGCEIDQPLHLGGPCEGMLTVLHSAQDLGEVEVMQGVYFTAARDKIERIMSDDPKPAKYFAGYSGWSAGQLEAELEEPSWLVADAEPEDAFASDPDELWRNALHRLGGRYALMAAMPFDPRLN